MAKECDICTTGGAGSLKTDSIRLQDYLDMMYTGGRALETWGRFEEFLRYETLFFDVIPYKDPTTGEQYLTYKFKDGLSQVAEVMFSAEDCTTPGCKIYWIEPKICGDETELDADATAGQGVRLKIKDLSALSGIGAGASLIITSKETGNPVGPLYIAAVHSQTNEIELADELLVDLQKGSIVRRGPYLRNRGCDASIENTVELGGVDRYSAYTRTVSISHEINLCELNTKYLVDGGIQAIINARFRKGEAEAAREFIYAAFFDRNKVVGDFDKGFHAKTETMGLFPAMKAAQENGVKIAFDLEGCCLEGANVCEQARRQIEAFLEIVCEKAMESGMYGNKVTVAMNKEARRGLHMMQQHFQDYGNVGFMDGSSYDVNIDMPRIKFAGIEVEFKYLPILDMFNYSAMLTIPEDKVGVYQQMYSIVNPDNGMKLEQAPLNSTIANGTPVLRYFQPNRESLGAQLGECQSIVGDIKFAVIWLWVDKGAYRFIKNFGKCVLNPCNVCTETEGTFLEATV